MIGGWITPAVHEHRLYKAVRDLEDRLGIKQGKLAPDPGTDVTQEPLAEEALAAGSTTETADAMSLHRHTVGYRLSRVQEVSGLSPYESDGRERLSLGLKAGQILEADKRRTQ